MLMMTPHILKSVDFTKTQKSRSLENKRLLFSPNKKKKAINYTYCVKSVRMHENTDQNNSEYGPISSSVLYGKKKFFSVDDF